MNFSITSLVGLLPFSHLSAPNQSCADSDGPVTLELPEQWLWDIVDEFIYQFQSFCVWTAKVKTKSDEELLMLADGGQVCLIRCAGVLLTSSRAGLECIQRLECTVLAHPKIQNQ